MAAETKRKPARLTALLLYLMECNRPVSMEDIRRYVGGYEESESTVAFKRMFQRDRKTLEQCGIVLEESKPEGLSGDDGTLLYSIKSDSCVSADIHLSPKEVALLRAVASQALSNAAFPLSEDLRLALNKLSDALGIIAPQDQQSQNSHNTALVDTFSEINTACLNQRSLAFDYVNRQEEFLPRVVLPHALFFFKGEWYLFATDTQDNKDKDFRVSRMSQVALANPSARKSEFEPRSINTNDLVKLPFQCGKEPSFTATIAFDASATWRAQSCTLGKGELQTQEDGTTVWTVEANSTQALCCWIIENAPGVKLLAPKSAVQHLKEGLENLAFGKAD